MASVVSANQAIPAATVPVLASDGTLTLPWRKFFQGIIAAANGIDIAALLLQIAQLATEVTATQAIANEALEEANAVTDIATTAEQLAVLGLTSDEASIPNGGITDAVGDMLVLLVGLLDLNPTDTLAMIAAARGSILYMGATGWTALPPGIAGQVLETQGAGADPIWGTVSGGGGSWIPLVTGAMIAAYSVPQPVFVTDGAGVLILVAGP